MKITLEQAIEQVILLQAQQQHSIHKMIPAGEAVECFRAANLPDILAAMLGAQASIADWIARHNPLVAEITHQDAIITAQATEIEQQKAVLEKLPITRDGVRVIPGKGDTKLFNPDYFGTKRFEVYASYIEWDGSMWFVGWGDTDYDVSPLSEWFADREEAIKLLIKETQNAK